MISKTTEFGLNKWNLISMDGDTYEEDDTVLEYEEWSKPEENIKSGLTVVID